MPIYEYECLVCKHTFERLVRPSSTPQGESLECPACGAPNPQRLLSGFAVKSDATERASLMKARKEGEKGQRDKKEADKEDQKKAREHYFSH